MKTNLTPGTACARLRGSAFAAAVFGALLPAVPVAAAPPAPATVRDRLWVWALDACFDWAAHEEGTSPGKNRMTPVEGAVYLGVPNVMFIQYQGVPAAPFEQYYTPLKAMERVYWTLSNNGNQAHELGEEQEHVYRLAAANPNITGLLLDDFLIGPLGAGDDPHWLAANHVAFPVDLVLTLPHDVVADVLQLTQTAWTGGGYLTGRVAVELTQDGSRWQEVATGALPAEAGASMELSFPEQRFRSLRLRLLSTLDTELAMSCGLKEIALFGRDQPIPLAGAQIRASSEYPGHEALRLLAPKAAAGAQVKVFASQVSPRDLAVARQRLQALGGRQLDLAVVVYSHQLEEEIVPILQDVDTVLFWTWRSADLASLEPNFRRLKDVLPGKRVILGCYLWDFSLPTSTIPLTVMDHQCELGRRWLHAGEIEGIVFLGSNIMDKGLEAVEWTRQWIAEHGEERIPAGP